MMRVEPSQNPKTWYQQAQALIARHMAPSSIEWEDQSASQLSLEIEPTPIEQLSVTKKLAAPDPAEVRTLDAPHSFVELLTLALCYRDAAKYHRLYRLLWRLSRGEPDLLQHHEDAEVSEVERLAKAVSRDLHKMKAFIRFGQVERSGDIRLVAWYEPEHLIVRLAAPFFVQRLGGRKWSILTPDECAHWNGQELKFEPGLDSPPDDVQQSSRVPLEKPPPIRRKTLSAAEFVPKSRSYVTLSQAVQHCRGCALYRTAHRAVFGQGAVPAALMIVGEQPGEREDFSGEPWLGPPGEILTRALREIGLERDQVYVTNGVKHFKFIQRGELRLQQKPFYSEIMACRPWLEAEMAMVKPKVIVCLGKTAAQSVLRRSVRIEDIRGTLIPRAPSGHVLVTIHPSTLLRMQDPVQREEEFAALTRELKLAAERAGSKNNAHIPS